MGVFSSSDPVGAINQLNYARHLTEDKEKEPYWAATVAKEDE